MKAVFLDRNTFSPTIELPAPAGVTDWQVFEATANDTTGINNIDAEACKTHGVQLCNVAGYSTTTVP